MNWLPTYFVKARGIDFDQLTYAASLPYVAGFVSFVLYAYLGDKTNRRINVAGIGFWGADDQHLFGDSCPQRTANHRGIFLRNIFPDRLRFARICDFAAFVAGRDHRQGSRRLPGHLGVDRRTGRDRHAGPDRGLDGQLRRRHVQRGGGHDLGWVRDVDSFSVCQILAVKY